MRILLLASCFALIAQMALADDQDPLFMAGAYIGPEIPTTSGGIGTTAYVLRAGKDISQSSMGNGHLGLVVGFLSTSLSASGVTTSENDTGIMAEYVAREAFGTGLYFGGRIGIDLVNINVSGSGLNAPGSSSTIMWAPVVGYEIPLSKQIDVSGDFSWLNHGGGTLTVPGVATVNYNPNSALLLLGGLNYHF